MSNLSDETVAWLFETLQERFENHSYRHVGWKWEDVTKRMQNAPGKLLSLYQMEVTGGEPDVVDYRDNMYIWMDCARESPHGRRGCCYDLAALQSRKKYPPEHNAIDLASQMGVDILTEEQYRFLQTKETVDTKSSSWLRTPQAIRDEGGAIFGDCHYNHVFIYHNSASSYYKNRGFRSVLFI